MFSRWTVCLKHRLISGQVSDRMKNNLPDVFVPCFMQGRTQDGYKHFPACKSCRDALMCDWCVDHKPHNKENPEDWAHMSEQMFNEALKQKQESPSPALEPEAILKVLSAEWIIHLCCFRAWLCFQMLFFSFFLLLSFRRSSDLVFAMQSEITFFFLY